MSKLPAIPFIIKCTLLALLCVGLVYRLASTGELDFRLLLCLAFVLMLGSVSSFRRQQVALNREPLPPQDEPLLDMMWPDMTSKRAVFLHICATLRADIARDLEHGAAAGVEARERLKDTTLSDTQRQDWAGLLTVSDARTHLARQREKQLATLKGKTRALTTDELSRYHAARKFSEKATEAYRAFPHLGRTAKYPLARAQHRLMDAETPEERQDAAQAVEREQKRLRARIHEKAQAQTAAQSAATACLDLQYAFLERWQTEAISSPD